MKKLVLTLAVVMTFAVSKPAPAVIVSSMAGNPVAAITGLLGSITLFFIVATEPKAPVTNLTVVAAALEANPNQVQFDIDADLKVRSEVGMLSPSEADEIRDDLVAYGKSGRTTIELATINESGLKPITVKYLNGALTGGQN